MNEDISTVLLHHWYWIARPLVGGKLWKNDAATEAMAVRFEGEARREAVPA